jgi:hypothetical protein
MIGNSNFMIRLPDPHDERTAMSERDGYEPGIPCWVETRQPDTDPRGATISISRVVPA